MVYLPSFGIGVGLATAVLTALWTFAHRKEVCHPPRVVIIATWILGDTGAAVAVAGAVPPWPHLFGIVASV
jgi:4-hydroxybenzoate polyprenyltransferase